MRGMACLGGVRYGVAGEVGLGVAWRGLSGQGKVWSGVAGWARLGQAWQCGACYGKVRLCKALQARWCVAM